MAIEVRQLLIRSYVDSGPDGSGRAGADGLVSQRELQDFRQRLLAECQAMLHKWLNELQER